MAKAMLALLLLAFLLFCPHGAAGAKGSFFRLKRRYGRPKPSFHQGHLLAHLQVHDKLRHSRLLASAETFPLGGTADPFMAGLYFTEVQLGSPPSKYYVQVDTGSDLLWLNCASCRTCPTSTDLGVHLALYDPQKSSSSSILLCGDVYCDAISEQVCQTGQLCSYELGYGDGSSSQGYYVRDTFHPNIVAGDYSVKMGNASVTFGCGIIQGGDLRQQDQALDGIIGFGQSTNSSVVLQLANQKQAPAVFAHCLEGEGDGGGMLVIGKVQAQGLVYTPIVPNQPHYNVNLKSIAVNGVTIPVDSSVSGSSQRSGTIIDSGTTLAYFATAAYEQLLAAVGHTTLSMF